MTTIKVDSTGQAVSGGKTFILNVSCIPGQQIKAFELTIVYDPSLLIATAVAQGTIFTGYTTFFNAGTIDNTGGTITNIYSLILGNGLVSTKGTLIKISFIARSVSGISSIRLMNVGVTNTTAYVPISTTDGSVQVVGINQPPVILSESPGNRSTDIPITRSTLSVRIQDSDNDAINYTIQTRPTIGSVSAHGVLNGVRSCNVYGLMYNTTYRWWVNATDGKSWVRRWYVFTTAAAPLSAPPVFSSISPVNGSVNVPLSTSSVSMVIQDPGGMLFNYTFQTRPNIGSVSGMNAGNGTKSCTIFNLAYGTTYRWWVNATDGKTWTRRWYVFTTVTPHTSGTLAINEMFPSNNTIDIPVTRSALAVTVQTEKGHPFSWSLQTTPNIGSSSDSNAFNGSKICNVSGLNYATTYHWWFNATDGTTTIRQWFVFTTTAAPIGTGPPAIPPDSEMTPYTSQEAPSLPAANDNHSNTTAITLPQKNTETTRQRSAVSIVNSPIAITTDETVQFTVSTSEIPPFPAVSYYWKFSDGGTSSGSTVVHTFTAPGKYNVVLIAIKSIGTIDYQKIIVSVAASSNKTPTAEPGFPSIELSIGVCVGLTLILLSAGVLFSRKNRSRLSKASFLKKEAAVGSETRRTNPGASISSESVIQGPPTKYPHRCPDTIEELFQKIDETELRYIHDTIDRHF